MITMKNFSVFVPKKDDALLGYTGENLSRRFEIEVDDPGAWDETSGSAMFAYAFQSGVNHGLLDAATYGAAARKAYDALVARLDEHANIADVCEGTVKKNDRDHYLQRPRVNGAPYGQAGLMWVCNALLTEDR